MKKKVLSALLCVVLMAAMLTGCKSSTDTTGSTGTEKGTETADQASDEKFTIGVLMSDNSDTFIQKITDGIKAQAGNYAEIELLVSDAEGDTENMITQCENFITQQVDAIIMNAVDSEGCNPIVEQCNEAGIPLVEVNRLTTNENYQSYTGSNDVEASKIQAEFLKTVLKDDAQIAYMQGPMGISPQILRKQGFDEYLIQGSNIKVLQEQTANWKRDEALSLAEDWLTRYPDLNAIVCQNDDMAMGAIEAVQAAGKGDQVIVAGIDAISDALQAVKDGTLACTVYQDAAGQGSKAVDVALALAKGETVEKENLIPFQLVTKENVDQFIQ